MGSYAVVGEFNQSIGRSIFWATDMTDTLLREFILSQLPRGPPTHYITYNYYYCVCNRCVYICMWGNVPHFSLLSIMINSLFNETAVGLQSHKHTRAYTHTHTRTHTECGPPLYLYQESCVEECPPQHIGNSTSGLCQPCKLAMQ